MAFVVSSTEQSARDNSSQVEEDRQEGTYELLPLYALVPVVVVVSLVVVVGVVGNLLVLVSYRLDPRLRTVSNLYLFHLAIVDLLLAAVSMPFELVSVSMKSHWPFGQAFCKAYHVVDYTLCCTSVILVIFISLDQLLIFRKGANYTSSETRFKVYVKLAGGWLFAFLLYGPAIIGWDIWRGYSILTPDQCEVEFINTETFQLVTVSLEFGAGSVVLVGLNLAVYWHIRKRTRASMSDILTGRSAAGDKDSSSTDNRTIESAERCRQDHSRGGQQAVEKTETTSAGVKPHRLGSKRLRKAIAFVLIKQDPESNVTTDSESNADVNHEDLDKRPSCVSQTKRSRSVRKDLRAARALFIIVFTFLLLWAPFSISAVIISFCEDCVHPDAYEFFVWWLWVKAAVDPLLYAVGNRRFKRNFIKIFRRVFACCQGITVCAKHSQKA